MIKIPFFSNKKNNPQIKPLVLVVLDGFGSAPASSGNAISLAKTPNIDSYFKTYPHTDLIASGESVGLPANEVGNTEVGHLTLGAGRTMYQELKRIDMSIEKGLFYDNKAFLKAVAHAKSNNSKLHLLGLIGSGRVHSSVEHLYALLQFCKKENMQNVYLHIFTDGRDSPPQQGIEILQDIQEKMKSLQIGKIATVAGRYYAMDRDRRWDRTKKAYDAIALGKGVQSNDPVAAIKSSYDAAKTDEFIEPTVITSEGRPVATINDNDAAIFFNFRIDRPRQLSMALVMKDFEKIKSFDFEYDKEMHREEGEVQIASTFQREKVPQNLFFVSMTQYAKNLKVGDVAFRPEQVVNSLSEVVSKTGLKQMHMSESEKERFVTYYFNGLREVKFEGEDVHIVPSPKVATYDKQPEMSLPKLVEEFKKELYKDKYHFFIINFANPDMVAHSGNISATIQAIEYVDKYLHLLVEAVLLVDGTVFITADHGNAEELLTFPNHAYFITSSEGDVNTDHSNNPVPLLIISNKYKNNSITLAKGSLADVAPTILGELDIQKPAEITGVDLLAKSDSHTFEGQTGKPDSGGTTSSTEVNTKTNSRFILPQYE